MLNVVEIRLYEYVNYSGGYVEAGEQARLLREIANSSEI